MKGLSIEKAKPDRSKHWGFGKFNLDKLSVAVVAINQDNSHGTVLQYYGRDITMMIEEHGVNEIDELWMSNGAGLWIWEGHGVWIPGPYEYQADGDFEMQGEFRRPTADELSLIAVGKLVFNPKDWDAPEEDKLVVAKELCPMHSLGD